MNPALGTLLLVALLGAAPSPFRFSPRPHRAQRIAWQPWGEEAFATAKRLDRPLLVSLSAVWCHWCHELDEHGLSDPEVQRLLAEGFVSLRVDADQRPDVERRVLGEGWPTLGVLDHDGTVLVRTGYLPPEELRVWLRRVGEAWQGGETGRHERFGLGLLSGPSQGAPGTLEQGEARLRPEALVERLDAQSGGLEGVPHFAGGELHRLLLREARWRGLSRVDEAARGSWRRVLASPLQDAVAGGWHRYASQEGWRGLHTEKLLSMQAELLRTTAELAEPGPDEGQLAAMRRTVAWVEAVLGRSDGLWGASQDADEAWFARDAAARAKTKAPTVDRTVLTDRVAHWCEALAIASVRFGEPAWRKRSADALNALLGALVSPRGLPFHARREGAAPELEGRTSDVAALVLALQAQHGADGDERWLREASRLLEAAVPKLLTAEGNVLPGLPSIDGLQEPRSAEDAAEFGRALVVQGALVGREEWLRRGRQALASVAASSGPGMERWSEGAALAGPRALRVVVVGPAGQGAAADLFAAAQRELRAPLLLRRLTARTTAPSQLGELSFPVGPPAAYVCRGAVCSRPLRTPEALREGVGALLRPAP